MARLKQHMFCRLSKLMQSLHCSVKCNYQTDQLIYIGLERTIGMVPKDKSTEAQSTLPSMKTRCSVILGVRRTQSESTVMQLKHTLVKHACTYSWWP